MNIFGCKIKIVYSKIAEERGILGLYSYKNKSITLDIDQSKEEMIHSIIHELVHATSHRLGWNQFVPPQAEEMIAQQFATVLCENFDIKLKK